MSEMTRRDHAQHHYHLHHHEHHRHHQHVSVQPHLRSTHHQCQPMKMTTDLSPVIAR